MDLYRLVKRGTNIDPKFLKLRPVSGLTRPFILVSMHGSRCRSGEPVTLDQARSASRAGHNQGRNERWTTN